MESTIATNNPEHRQQSSQGHLHASFSREALETGPSLSRGRVSVLKPPSGPMANGANGNSSIEETHEKKY